MKKEIEFRVELRWYSLVNEKMISPALEKYTFKTYDFNKEEFKNWLLEVQTEMDEKYGAYYKNKEKVCFLSTIYTTPYLNMENGTKKINLFYKGCFTPIFVGDYGSIEDLFKQIEYFEDIYNIAKKLVENM